MEPLAFQSDVGFLVWRSACRQADVRHYRREGSVRSALDTSAARCLPKRAVATGAYRPRGNAPKSDCPEPAPVMWKRIGPLVNTSARGVDVRAARHCAACDR